MQNSNLLLTFQMTGARGTRTEEAARIMLDGRGSLLVYGAQGGVAEKLTLAQLGSFSVQRLPATRATAQVVPIRRMGALSSISRRPLSKLRTPQFSPSLGLA